jgi:cyclic-di-GMP-binding protein
MAKDNSFDIVSEVDMQEVDNAVQQASREVAQRYDLKDTKSQITLDKHGATITIVAPDDFVLKSVKDVLASKLIARKIDLKAIQWPEKPEAAAGSTVRLAGGIVAGIPTETTRAINKAIKDRKFKVKVTIEGDKLRVSGAKRDELQEVIAFVKGEDFGIPLQFSNYR